VEVVGSELQDRDRDWMERKGIGWGGGREKSVALVLEFALWSDTIWLVSQGLESYLHQYPVLVRSDITANWG